MDTLITILKGAAVFTGFGILIAPIAVQMVTGSVDPKTKLGKIYWEILPMIILGGVGLAALIMAFWALGKEF
jgi:hypothetical protein